jgi:hypothetical protein
MHFSLVIRIVQPHTAIFPQAYSYFNQRNDYSLGMLQQIAMRSLFCCHIYILMFCIQDLVETCVYILRDLLLQMTFKFLFGITHLVNHPLRRVIPTGISIRK